MNSIRVGGVYGLVALVGAVAFGWPFLLARNALLGHEHSGDAWLWIAILGAFLVGALVLEVRSGSIPSAQIAVLGVLSASIGLLRLLELPGGGNGLYFLLVLSAAAFGPRFGVLLGLSAMAASAVITAGIGPWLPFQMLAFAAMGAAAGGLGRFTVRLRPRTEIAVLAAFGWCFAFVFGALMNLWSWPLIQDGGALSYAPGLGVATTLHRYWSFYLATSFAWDAAGALANVVFISVLGLPILASLRRIAHRLAPVARFQPV